MISGLLLVFGVVVAPILFGGLAVRDPRRRWQWVAALVGSFALGILATDWPLLIELAILSACLGPLLFGLVIWRQPRWRSMATAGLVASLLFPFTLFAIWLVRTQW